MDKCMHMKACMDWMLEREGYRRHANAINLDNITMRENDEYYQSTPNDTLIDR
jgi:hypothetical protein